MRVKWFIEAHRNSIVNSVEIVESFKKDTDELFILTAGQDRNILLHKLSTG